MHTKYYNKRWSSLLTTLFWLKHLSAFKKVRPLKANKLNCLKTRSIDPSPKPIYRSKKSLITAPPFYLLLASVLLANCSSTPTPTNSALAFEARGKISVRTHQYLNASFQWQQFAHHYRLTLRTPTGHFIASLEQTPSQCEIELRGEDANYGKNCSQLAQALTGISIPLELLQQWLSHSTQTRNEAQTALQGSLPTATLSTFSIKDERLHKLKISQGDAQQLKLIVTSYQIP